MILRTATAQDLPAIARIQAGSPEASPWNPADYLEYCCWVAESEQEVSGFLVARQTPPDEYEVLNLAVDPSLRRKGVATGLILNALNIFPGTWFLEVRQSNVTALKLYYSLGFEQVGVRKDYYRQPCESAIVMRKIS
jgi:[ribosomal protein S18]-alanine N-acetyltransferase